MKIISHRRAFCRMRRHAVPAWTTLVVLLMTLAAVPAFGQAIDEASAQGSSITVEQWRADLMELVDHVRSNHRNAFHSIAPDEFDVAVDALLERLPSLSGSQITGELAKLLASVGDGHTRLAIPVNPTNLGYRQGHNPDPDPAPGAPRFHTLPLRFADFEGGVHVASATVDHADLVGARIVAIAGDPVEEVVDRLGPFVARDVPAGQRFHAVKLLAVPELVALAGTDSSPSASVVTLVSRAGKERTVTLEALAYEDEVSWVEPERWVFREADEPYFEIETDRDDALIVRIYQMNDSPTETIGEFARRVSEAIEEHDPERVVLDLRYCHGGDQSLSRALVLPLIRWDGSQAPGRLFALVGPETFSAAVNLSARLEEWTQVTFVGERLGSGPTHYSSSDREVLDNSQLVARVSTGYFVGWTGSEWRESVEIRLPVKPDIDDYLVGTDTALEAALDYEVGGDVTSQLIQAHRDAGINAALIMWSHYRTDPATAHLDHEAAGNAFARFLLESDELLYAANIFLFNREFHPDSIDAFVGEAEARHLMGDTSAARAILEQARGVAPGDSRIEAMAQRIGFVPVSCARGLGADARCATLTVPENRAVADGRNIEIHVAVLPALKSATAEPLLLFPGGPGQATTDLADLAQVRYVEVRDHRDVVLVGQRGAGISHPLRCHHDVAASPELAFGQLWDVDRIRGCAAAEAERSDLSAYATADYVADIAEAVDALGYDKAVLWGGSGGSRTAAAFIREHPDHVAAAVLDGVVPIDYAMPLPFSESLQEAWNRVVADCAEQSECAGGLS
ncbi:MAG: alpha/beta fold hydrolase [Acidobacteria bacterium]|nr:alpha/beta fold hydrolase [Acidobacteriota bacterium]